MDGAEAGALPNIKLGDEGATGVEEMGVSCAKSIETESDAAIAQIRRNFAIVSTANIRKMKFIAVALVVVGIVGAIFSNVKYRQQLEWEHWAEKLTYLLATIGSSAIAVVGAALLIASFQPE